MDTAEVAIVLSIFSVVISGLSLGWNIYRDVILKAKVKLTFGVRTLIQHGSDHKPEYVVVSATNHGPGPVTLSMVQMKNSSWWRWLLRKQTYAVVIHDYSNPLSGQLPHKLEIGEKMDLLFPYDEECMLRYQWSHVGISDLFDRVHWAAPEQVREAVKKWKRDFGNTHNKSLSPDAQKARAG